MTDAFTKQWEGQLQASLSLHKSTKDEKYFWWSVVCRWLLARFGEETQAKLQISLAERLCDKALQEGRMTTLEQLRIYIDILLHQGKKEKAVQSFDADPKLKSLMKHDPDLNSLKLDLLVHTQAFATAQEFALELLKDSNNWDIYKNYAKCVVEAQGHEMDGWDRLSEFAKDPERARNACLAQVELTSLLTEAGKDPIVPPSKLVWDYIDRFGAKAVCFSDLKPYVISWFGKTQGFLAEFRLTLESKFADAVATFADNKAMPVERLATLQKFAWLASCFDTENSPASSLDRAKTLIEIGLTKDCAEEQQLALGELVLLGCHYLIFAAQKFEELEDVSTAEALRFQSLCMLLAGLRRNKDDFQLKLLAIRLYNQLGGYMHARELYQSLNNRNVQHDTLSYLIVGHGAIFGHRQQDLDAIYDALEIYQQSEAQMPGMIKLAFENGVYSKVPEFVEFQRRLTNSIQQAVSIRYATRNEIVGLRNGADALREWQQVDLGVFKGKPVSRLWDDNRDTDVLFCCSPPDNDRRSIERLTRTLPLPDEHWIDVFGEISKLMVHISNRDVGQAQRSVEKLEELLEKGEDPEDSSLPAHELVLARNTLSLGKFAIKALRDGDKVVADAGLLDALFDPWKQVLAGRGELGELSKIYRAELPMYSAFLEWLCHVSVVRQIFKGKTGKVLDTRLRAEIKEVSARLNQHFRMLTAKKIVDSVTQLWADPELEFAGPICQYVCQEHAQIVKQTVSSLVKSWSRSVKMLRQEIDLRA